MGVLKSLLMRKATDAQWQEASSTLSRLGAGRVVVINGHRCKKDKLGFISVDGSNPLPAASAMRRIFPEGYDESTAPKGLKGQLQKSVDEYRSESSGKKVVVTDGIVTYSDVPEYCPVGQKPNLDFLRSTGWKKPKRPRTQYDAWGRPIDNKGLKSCLKKGSTLMDVAPQYANQTLANRLRDDPQEEK